MKPKKYLSVLILLSVLIICALTCFLTACGNKDGGKEDDTSDTPPVVAVTGVTLNENVLTLTQGQTFKLVATVQPSNATDKTVTYSVPTGSQYVSVSPEGIVTANAVGPAVVSVTTRDGGFYALCSIAVVPLQPTGITLDKSSLVLDRDESYKLTAAIQPIGALGAIIFQSEDPTIATVDQSGTVTGVKKGETKIKAYVSNTITTECAVRVGYKVTVQTTGSGEVKYDDYYYYGGSYALLEATPKIGYTFEGWYENELLLSDETGYYFCVYGDATVTAKFVVDPDAPKKNAAGFYEIETNKNLIWATKYENESYILIDDFSTDVDFKGFNNFNGIFDGNGHTISSLGTQTGFFETLKGTVKNLNLTDVYCNSDKATFGLLASSASGATIENCRVQGRIIVRHMNSNYSAGGLVGYASGTVIKNCSMDIIANITADFGNFGGLAGTSYGCQISFCSAKINTDNTFYDDKQYFGGLIGRTYPEDSVTDCYATGSITVKITDPGYNRGNIYVGGALGQNSGTVERCYSGVNITLTGSATMSSGYVAGFCGYNGGTVKNSVYCGLFSADGEVSSCAVAFAKGGTLQNVYVMDGAVNFEFDDTAMVAAENLTEEFFRNTLNFGYGWVFEEGKFPHF